MADTWDEEGFEPAVQPTVTGAGNRWEGEDEEEDVKECWEDDEEEKKDEEKVEEKVVVAPPPKSKAKKLAEKLAEKEKAALYEVDEDLLDGVGLTKEEIEVRRRRMQEESDLKVAMETFGITETATITGLDAFNPTTKEEFDEFQKALVDKISLYRDKEEFPEFITALVKNICLHLNSITLKSLKTNIENLYLEKQKLEKADKSKKPNKGKGKAKLTVESNISQMTRYGFENEFEYEDFM